MKKAFLLFIFLCVSTLCCFAQDNETPLFFPYFSLPTQTPKLGFSTANSVLSANLLTWQQADLGLTKLSDDYRTKSFFEVTSPVLPGIIALGGLIMVIAGAFAFADSSLYDDDAQLLGMFISTGGGTMLMTVGVLWIVFVE